MVLAAESWRAAAGAQGAKLLKVKNELRTVPEAFVYNGSNYLLKMLTDMDGLPLPGGSDPFFLRWFGRDSRWWHIPGLTRARTRTRTRTRTRARTLTLTLTLPYLLPYPEPYP